MKTIILPGYSISNKDWADEVSAYLNEQKIETVVNYWEHWKTNGSLKLKFELEKILRLLKNEDKINVIAKSVGTMVVAKFLEKNGRTLNKLILCGIPSTSDKRLEIFNRAFASLSPNNLICFQNSNDPFASYNEVKNFIAKVNPKIKVIEKTASNHSYPYYEDFKEFLV